MQETSFTSKVNKSMLSRIVSHLILNASFIENIGLYHGKMGVILFLYKYAKYANKPNIDEFAGELLNDVCQEIHLGIDIDFENGLCGIGWSIEYLLENSFLDGNSLNILKEIDLKIMEKNLLRVNDMTTETGLTGISYYIHKHLNSVNKHSKKSPFDKKYIADWKNVSKHITIPNDDDILLNIISYPHIDNHFIKWKLGLKNGCAGYGLNNLL